MPPEQTKQNKAGHVAALALGFESCGPGVYGWRDAKVRCTTCGHRLPWYHRVYQVQHREHCKPAAPTIGRLYLGAAGSTPSVEVGEVLEITISPVPDPGPPVGIWSPMLTTTEEDPCCDGCDECDGGGY